jgi:DNA-binding response OmpR family regulator
MTAAPADIVILDYMLGSEEGVTFARWLRNAADSPAPYTPIILLTGHADRAKLIAARDAGVNEFCVKPVTPADLMKRIAWVIDKPRPFVRSADYFGPDRRRRDDPNYNGPERRADRQPKT